MARVMTRMLVTSAVLGAAWQPSVAAETVPAPTSAEAFAQIPFIDEAEISPDGDFMAGLFGVAGERRICAMNLFDQGKFHCIAIPDGTQPFALRWVNDRNIVISLEVQQNIGSGEVTGSLMPSKAVQLYVSRVVAMNRDTGKLTRLLPSLSGQKASDVLWVASDGSPIVEIAGQQSLYDGNGFWPAVYRVNVETGQSTEVQRSHVEVFNWSADGHGTIRTGIGYNDATRATRLYYRPERGGDLNVIQRAETRKREDLLDPVLFLPGTDRALVTHADENGFTTLYETDLMTQKDVRTVFAASAGADIAEVEVDDAGTTLLAARDSNGNVHWFDPALATLQAQFDKTVSSDAAGNRRATIISLDRNRQRMLVRIDRPDSPGSLFYYDVAAGAMQRIAYYNERLGRRPLSPVSLIHYQARDGLPIEAVLTLPEGRAAKALPIVVLPHGGPWARDSLNYDYWAQFIASLGYAVLQPNFRGSTGYGTVFERKGEGQLGLAMQDDITDGLRWAVAQGIADPKRACIVGGSYGGYAAMWGIAKDPDLYRCAISIAGVSSLRSEVDDFDHYLNANEDKDGWKRMTPDFSAVSPLGAVDRIKTPLLLVHGEKDTTVDISQSRMMNRRMLAAGKIVQFVDLPLADHKFGREADRRKLLTALGEFLARYNPADPAPVAGH